MILLISAEILVLMFMVYLGATIRFFDHTDPFPSFSSLFPEAATFTFVMILCMSAMGLYQLDARLDIKDTLFRLMPSMMLGFGITTLIFYLLPDLYLGRGILGLVMLFALSGILLTRAAFLMVEPGNSGVSGHRIRHRWQSKGVRRTD